MPCFAKNLPLQRTQFYGRAGTTKNVPQRRTERYLDPSISEPVDHFHTPTTRMANYGAISEMWQPQHKCAKEAYCVLGKDKQWAVVRIGDRSKDDTEHKFKNFSAKWHQQIGPDSSLSNIVGNINYLQVIAMGKKVVPLILQELEREPAPWFVALQAITGENPVDHRSAGNFPKIAEAWLQWGRDRGFINGAAVP